MVVMSQEVEIHRVSTCIIKPHQQQEGQQQQQQPCCYLTPSDLAMLSVHYIQKGLFFTRPPHLTMHTILQNVKHSLSQALALFYPLAGRLVTRKTLDPPSYYVFLDCTDAPGADFIYATADATLADVTSPQEVPSFVQSLFAFDEIINHDGHTKPLLAIQVTQFSDAIFIGCSFNHVAGDGTSFWNFFNAWSEISRGIPPDSISRPPITKRWFQDHHGPIINLPFSHHHDFIQRFIPPPLREIIFHFSPQSISRLKEKANSECNSTTISSFQAFSALVWRSITRARQLPIHQKTSCRLACDNRSRLEPPLSKNYFGNFIQVLHGTTTAGELVANNLGWSAWILHQAVSTHSDKQVRTLLDAWVKAPWIYQYKQAFDAHSVMMGSSPRFDMYNNDFGWGKPVAIRSGFGSKFDGKVSSYQGSEEGGIDIEVCLYSNTMTNLLSDEEFTDALMQ